MTTLPRNVSNRGGDGGDDGGGDSDGHHIGDGGGVGCGGNGADGGDSVSGDDRGGGVMVEVVMVAVLMVALGVISKKQNSIFKGIIQIEVDPPPSHPIFDTFIFDKVLIMFPPLEFLTKTRTF